MKPARLRRIIRGLDDLPTLPRTVLRITELINNPKSSARDLARVITDDQVLTARLLRLVNSSFYGFPQKITTVTAAIVLVGFEPIRHLLLSTSIFDLFSSNHAFKGLREQLWDHSLACALGAKAIGQRILHDKVEELFVCALLHDIGKIVAMHTLGAEYSTVVAAARDEHLLLLEVETRRLPFTHAEIGGLLAEKWNLPPMVAEVIQFHHAPLDAGAFAQEAAVVHVADIFCRAAGLGSGGDSRVPWLQPASWDMLGLSLEDIAPLMADMVAAFGEISPFTRPEAPAP
jgi:putative nucleotidyltransferase with HDIG domain